jgi:hypothetical protein
MIANIVTRLSKVETSVELTGATLEEFNKAFAGEAEDLLELDIFAVGSLVKIGNKVVGKVVSSDIPINEQYIVK